VIRTVKDFERAGVAGLFIEDQLFPKRCGHTAGKDVVSTEEMVPKLKAALYSRTDEDLVIMGRTDALGVLGIEDAIARANLYRQTGCDMVFVEAPETASQMRRICEEVDGPVLANMIDFGRSPLLASHQLQELVERWDLHRRFAAFVLGIVGNGPRRLVGGFMIVSAALSMWISNTAASVIMLPIALSVIAADDQTADYHPRFRMCLLLGTAYACSIGGMGTLIGTGTNVFLASFVESELQRDLSFAGWMRLGVPLVLVFLPLAWLLLTRVIFRLPAVWPRATQGYCCPSKGLGPRARSARLPCSVSLGSAGSARRYW